MKRLPAKPLNESSMYVASQRDKRKHSELCKKDPNDPRSIDELWELPFEERKKVTYWKEYQIEAWLRGEEYPMPYQIRMPEEGDILCEELMKGFNV